MLRDLLPEMVAVREAGPGADEAALGELFPEEAELVAGAVENRRREFAAARRCARAALAELGVAAGPIGRGADREPLWPDGVVGSLTHCEGYRAAAVARSSRVRSVGIDAEPARALREPAVLRLVALEGERGMLGSLARADGGVPWDRLLFSAKESVYKAWYPLTGRWLGFEDARVALAPDGTFSAELLVGQAPVPSFAGRWAVAGGVLVTAVLVPL
ncbi:hypothetical protein BIV57_17275 [Mangrovactinospora gilvigrisea]|uniref:4'-phosphopantetheinyl transferase n=1 Tax=Mangrovactinospora gilvigrisea TaxID=1428644 RepID=A0A1J7BC88_9ACTN|nr:4'-phosphopantetheinyl transferase superfamily protein [Mangrovactinospora gilvigrisea]OIV36254.1 hypothetical protein BIV57_17275 [Mangrovactinospora gilvigrisea]